MKIETQNVAFETLFDRKPAKSDHFWHFNELLSNQNVNVARFARNVE